MNNLTILLIVFLLCGGFLSLNSQTIISELLPDSVGEWKTEEEDKYFNDENLFEYINGGAELYISYGFNQVISRTYKSENQPDILVDIFEMKNSKNAYGVFTHSAEKITDEYGQMSFSATGVILFWKDNYYVSILNYPETEKSKTARDKLANFICEKIDTEGEIPGIVSLLPENNLVVGSIRYFRHPNWLNTYYYISSENILNITDETEAVFAKYSIDNSKSILLLIEYTTPEFAKEAANSFKEKYLSTEINQNISKVEDGSFSGYELIENYFITVFNSEKKDYVISLLSNSKEKLNKIIRGKE